MRVGGDFVKQILWRKTDGTMAGFCRFLKLVEVFFKEGNWRPFWEGKGFYNLQESVKSLKL